MTVNNATADTSVSAILSAFSHSVSQKGLPAEVENMTQRLLLDFGGLCIAARNADYVLASAHATDEKGVCTALGHRGGRNLYDAALLNGTAAHGEDFDDTFEGGPIHSSAVEMAALLAAGERFDLSGRDVSVGMAVGLELMCRLAMVAPKAIHKAGFHPTAVIGALGAAAGVGTALGHDQRQLTNALGIAGSMASGIIEYLADGSWTKRMHAGWAAQSGLKAAMLAKGGFVGPASVLEGTHGFFTAFAPSRTPNFDVLCADLGEHWYMKAIAFKPYACGTMTQPYVDCAIELAERGVTADEIESIVCNVGEGTVHRLWEPLADKQAPATAYFGKFSTPYCIAVGFLDKAAGLGQFTEERVRDPKVGSLASKVSYIIDPNNPYPERFTGHMRVRLKNGQTIEIVRANMRGGAHLPLADAELEAKFRGNVTFGGWSEAQADALYDFSMGLVRVSSMGTLAGFRC